MPDTIITATRYHDISCGHRVYGHEGKCQHLHGHNYRFHFTISAPMDALGRVLDFGVIKRDLCMWLEDNWDHRFLLWDMDPSAAALRAIDPAVVLVPFNPTAENMASFMVEIVGPEELRSSFATLVTCTVEETAKCCATATLRA